MSRKIGIWLLALLFAGPIAYAQAGGTKTVNMTLHLVITQPPPCTVKDVDTQMSTHITTEVPTGNALGAAIPVNIPVRCDWDISDTYRFIQLYIQGTTITVNNELVLKTSIPNLGIRLTQNGNTVPIGTTEGLSLNTLSGTTNYNFILQAQLVKKYPYEILPEGDYDASATMILEYQ